MASDPRIKVNRDVSDYLWSIDPSGQRVYGYVWSHCNQRPVDIYDLHGSGQCLDSHGNPSGVFKLYAKEYVQTVRAPTYRHPLRLSGPGYDIFGKAFGLVPSSGHSVFVDNTPVINWTSGDMSSWRSGPIDLRFDDGRGVWTAPYNGFIATILGVAGSGQAYNLNYHSTVSDLVSTQPVGYPYSIGSGLYRYMAAPFTVEIDGEQALSSFVLSNVAELTDDLPYLRVGDKVNVFRNPSILASGSFICNEFPCSFAAFL